MNQAEQVRELSDELVALQRPIRVLDAVAWGDEVADQFFASGACQQPAVDADYYRVQRPLAFDVDGVRSGLKDLEGRVGLRLGRSAVGRLLVSRAEEYRRVLDLLQARGTPEFSRISSELYGGPEDALHPGGPTLATLGQGLSDAMAAIDDGAWEPPEEPMLDAIEAVAVLQERLAPMFGADGSDQADGADGADASNGTSVDGVVRVMLDDGIVADAAAGSDYIKLRRDARFSHRDLRVLEVHEGWVHVATSLNGRHQPWCTFLGKGTPSTTVTQEGLAVFTELTTLSSTPGRLAKITRRATAIAMACDGASFLDVFAWFESQGLDRGGAWNATVRVFRGSTPEGGPFTKDLIYIRGFVEVYNLVRLAVRRGLLDRLALLFVGKLAMRELGVLAQLHEEGLVASPAYLPPQVADLRALAAWMAYSQVLHLIDPALVEADLDELLS
jgi:uncharacterized protein (TIGR02421 family)